ncbi:complement component C8 gamma chain isoform 3-T3 [Lycaon pictus]
MAPGPAGKCRVQEAGGGLHWESRRTGDFLGWRWTRNDFLCQASGRHWTMDSDLECGRPVLSLPQFWHHPCRCHADPLDCAPLDSAGWGLREPEGSETPSAGVPHQHHPARGQLRCSPGTWLLVAVASSCRFLQEQGHQAEATLLHVAPQGADMAVSTFQKLDGICWQVRQLYRDGEVLGRFLLQARGARGAVDMVVGETDYQGFAILYLEQKRQLSVKLYGASTPKPRLRTPTGPCTGRGGGGAQMALPLPSLYSDF